MHFAIARKKKEKRKTALCTTADPQQIELWRLGLINHHQATRVPGQSVPVIITVIATAVFIVLSLWHCYCESSLGSFDECSTSAGWPPAFVPSW